MPQTPALWRAPIFGTRSGAEVDPSVVQLGNGDIIVVYRATISGTTAGDDILSQRYDRFGDPVGSPVRVATTTPADNQRDPHAIATPDGGYVVVYSDTNATGTSIRLVRHNSSGVVQGGVLTVQADTTAGDPTYGQPAVAMSSMTTGLIVFERMAGGQASISARTYNASTNSVGPEFTVLSSNFGIQSRPSIATLTNGTFVVVADTGGADTGVMMRLVNASGVNITPATIIGGSASNGLDDTRITVEALSSGGFAVSWVQEQDSVNNHIQMQLFSNLGAAVTGVLTVNDQTARFRFAPEILSLGDGTFLMLYRQGGDLVVQRYTDAGATVGDPFSVGNPNFAFTEISATLLADGRIMVSFTTASFITSGDLNALILDVRDVGGGDAAFFAGTAGADTILSSATDVAGGAGDDVIHERGATGMLQGGDGDDRIVLQTGSKLTEGGAGIDTIDWSAVTHTPGVNVVLDMDAGFVARNGVGTRMSGFENLIGTTGTENIRGNALANEIYGLAGNELIEGRGGDDRLFGGDGFDRLQGGDGNDTLVGNDRIFVQEQDTMDGGAGDDTLFAEAVDIINGGQGFDTLIAVNSFNFTLDMAETSIEYAVLDFGDDNVDAELQTVGVSVFASGGADFVRGSGFADLIFGGVGADILRGGAGDDALVGEGGADSLDGGEGNDRLYIDFEDTAVDGGAGYDAAYITPVAGSTSGIFLTLFNKSIEFVQDLAGFGDVYNGRKVNQDLSIFAGGGNDQVFGGNGDDILFGEAGSDSLFGELGADTLVGGAGADVLDGGFGRDSLFGGLNDGAADIFRFSAFVLPENADAVHDFVRGQDKLDLRAFSGSPANVTFTVVGGSTVVRLSGNEICTVIGVTGMTIADLVATTTAADEWMFDTGIEPLVQPDADEWLPPWTLPGQEGDPSQQLFDLAVVQGRSNIWHW